MRIARILSLAAFGGLLVVTPASAQERGKVGITMGYPPSAGLLWHITDSVAIRPEVNFAGSKSEPDLADGWSAATGVSALFYLRRADNVRPYFSPRFNYQRTSFTSPTPFGGDVTRKTDAWGGMGAFGAQYSPNARFGVYGELGFYYNRSTAEATTFSNEVIGHSWGTRAGVGVVFYPGS